MQIVDDDLWFRVQPCIHANKRDETRHEGGRPPSYLLSGMARCGLCGGPIAVNTGKIGKAPAKVYLCQYHRTRGDEVCGCSLRRPVVDVDRAVIDYLARHVVTEDVIVDAIELLRKRMTDRIRTTGAEVETMESEAKRLRVEIANLVSAIAAGGAKANLDPLVEAVAQRQERASLLEGRIRAAKAAPEAIARELERAETEARSRLADFRSVLGSHPVEARSFLSQILAGPLRFTPEGNRFRIEGQVPAGAGLFGGMPNSASPGGFEHDRIVRA